VSARALFVAGSHTDVGKTHVACALIGAARSRGRSVEALKPVVSGFDPANWNDSDPGRLLSALGRAPTAGALEAISPWRFRAPLAPPSAARLEGRSLPLAPIVAFCRAGLAQTGADLLLVEGVGGLMSPIAEGATGLDLMLELGLPSMLVSGGYLGAISHTLTAVEVLRSRGAAPVAVVVSESGDPGAPDFGETVEVLASFMPDIPVIAAGRSTQRWGDDLLAAIGGDA
jgi:dethiobiotin synthetase